MSKLTITCDRQGDLVRAAVWQGRDLIDLYLDRLSGPDMTGAIAQGKVVRVSGVDGKAWVDCGLDEHVYLERAQNLRAGDRVTVRVQTTLSRGKAWVGKLTKEDECSLDKTIGLIVPPPLPWQRALIDIGPKKNVSVLFEDVKDFALFRTLDHPQAQAKLLKGEAAHPDLDEIIDALMLPEVPLKGGLSLVIEPTEALVAIDVNAGDAKSPVEVNCRAMREVARQIRLRNLSGIIVVDALKMKVRTDGFKVINALKAASETDPAGVQVFGITKTGLVEATRSRSGPSLWEFF